MAGMRRGRTWTYLKQLFSKLQHGFWWPPLALALLASYWYRRTESLPLPKDWSTESFGQYGDSFGALTSLFTALGLAG